MTARTAAATVLLAVALPLGLGACGGSDGDSKATTDLIAELRANGMKEKQAECIARAFEDADLTPDEVQAVGDGKVDDLDADALKLYAQSASACLGVKVEVPGS